MTRRSYLQNLTLLLAATFIVGCAGLQSSRNIVDNISFERIDSEIASPSNVYIHRTNKGMDLRGELKRKGAGRGPIPGHLHVTLIGPQGVFLKEADVDYKRHNTKSNHAHFSISLPVELEAGSTVRISHMAAERSDLDDHPKWGDSPGH